MIDHVSLRVSDFDRALTFFRAALAPLGYEVVMQGDGYAGLGAGRKPDFWLTRTDRPVNPTHIAFNTGRDRVDAFYAAAIAAGGSDFGPPGPRPHYHPSYYGAFVLDPEGNNIESCCHARPEAADDTGQTGGRAASKKAPSRRPATKPTKPTKRGTGKPAPKKPAARTPASKSATPKKPATKPATKPAKKPAARKPSKPRR